MPNTRSFHFSGDLGATLVGAGGISVGDFFSGHFAFDPRQAATATTPTSATYPLLSFAAGVPYTRLSPFQSYYSDLDGSSRSVDQGVW